MKYDTWSTPFNYTSGDSYMVNIVYKFESSGEKSVFGENASGNAVAIHVTVLALPGAHFFKYKIHGLFKDLPRTSQYFSRNFFVHVKKVLGGLHK